MLFPKKTKYKKYQRGNLKGKSISNNLQYGTSGLKALECGLITSRQIEAVRKVLIRCTKKQGKLFILIFPDLPMTARSEESRMGSGKGAISYWVAKVKPGMILFEFKDIPSNIAILAFKQCMPKLPIKTQFFSN